VYRTVVFVLESVVFGLIGLELPELVRATGHPGHWLVAALAVTGTLIATRVAWVFPLSAAYQWRRGTHRPAWPVPAVVSWAGTRGVVPLAAALSIPLTTASGAALPQRDLVLVVTAATIVISLITQGFTPEPLARLAGFGQADAAYPGHEETVARLRLAEAGLARLNELAENGAAPDAVIDRLRAVLQARIGITRDRLDQDPDTEPEMLPERELRADLKSATSAAFSAHPASRDRSSSAGAGGELAEAGADHRDARTGFAFVVPGLSPAQERLAVPGPGEVRLAQDLPEHRVHRVGVGGGEAQQRQRRTSLGPELDRTARTGRWGRSGGTGVTRDARLSASAVSAALRVLAEHGLAERGPGGWRRGPVALADVAESTGAADQQREREERYRRDRESWRARLRQYRGARRRPVSERDGWWSLDDPAEYNEICRWPVILDEGMRAPPALTSAAETA